ncbi:FecR family protein [Danxiaibacter flavus]|uniref:FecR family protein n=1 Tax=Danxiaibacter flavus TaxID=3049108 RepID=A0ABV3ZBP9_9BACT|nr:FecR family protein [Chitinophagaceae bacterium DXS]
MNDYRQYTVMNFVTDPDFMRWVRFGNPADEQFWNNWINNNPASKEIVEEARLLLLSVKTKEKTAGEEELQQEVDRLMGSIRTFPVEQKGVVRGMFVQPWMRIAASIIIILGCAISGYFLFSGGKKNSYSYADVVSGHNDLIERINSTLSPQKILLPDSSSVELAAGSRISYSATFARNATRDVYLSGEGFFTVTKDANHPFRVFANEIVTKVLGTSFIVKSIQGEKDIHVIVKTGKVSVYAQENASASETAAPKQLGGILLTPNQQVIYSVAEKHFEKKLVEAPEVVTSDETKVKQVQSLVFADAPVASVFEQMKTVYKIPIVYDAGKLSHCTITADCSNESFYNQLDLICAAINARYEVKDGEVVITAPGCK